MDIYESSAFEDQTATLEDIFALYRRLSKIEGNQVVLTIADAFDTISVSNSVHSYIFTRKVSITH
jgi:hypothetical protein